MPKIQGKIIFLRKIVLLLRRQNDSAPRTKTLGGFSLGQEPQKPFLMTVANVAT